jgi:HSP20 family molecular chaperone IbpA
MSDVKVQQAPQEKRAELSIFQEMDNVMDQVRQRAFDMFSGRGFSEGRALDDWLAAEREICWPAAELKEQDSKYELTVSLPGFKSDEVTVTATPKELIVHAKQESSRSSKEKEKDKGTVHWSEFRSNDVYRRVELPQAIDTKAVSTDLSDGLLKVTVKKAADSSRGPRAVAAA